MKNQNKALIYALSAVLLWSTVATAFSIALKKVDYLQLLLFSSFTAFIFMGFVVIFTKKTKLLLSVTIKDLALTIMTGFLNPFLYYLILFKAYSILPAQEAMALNYTWPLMIILFSVPVLKQKISFVGFLAILVSFVGVLVIAMKGNLLNFRLSNPLGDILALGSSVVWASFWMINIRSKLDESVKLFLSFGFGTIFSFFACLKYSGILIHDTSAYFSLIYVGLAEMGITFFLWMNALKLSDRADKVSQTIFLSPVLSLIFISIILGEKMHWSTPLGLFLILFGIFWSKRLSKTI
jgi:drug/metabolite transporter (DMT)-like permease